MANVQELRRVISIQTKESGAKQAATDLQKLDRAYSGVTVQAEKTTRATLSEERALRTLQTRLDPAFRATERLAAAERTLSAARAQGLISQERQTQLMALATAQTDRAGASTGRLAVVTRGIGGLGAGLGVASITALPYVIQRAISSVGDLADAATRAGVSAERLQVFRFALEQSGGAAEDADAALTRFTTGIGRLGTIGGGPAAAAMKALGVNVKDASGALRASEDVLDETIGKLSKIESRAAVAGLAASIFGKEAGPKMAGLLQQGEAGLEAYEKQLRETASLLSNETVDAADLLDDKFKALTNTVEVLAQTFAVGLGDELMDFVAAVRALGEGDLQTFMRLQAYPATPTGFLTRDLTRRSVGNISAGQDAAAQSAFYDSFGPTFTDSTKAAADATQLLNEKLAATGVLAQQLSGTMVPLSDTMKGRFTDAFADAITAAGKLAEVDIPLPHLRPEIDKVSDGLKQAQASAEGFASALVEGLAAGKGLVEALVAAVVAVAASGAATAAPGGNKNATEEEELDERSNLPLAA